ncbi:MAG TPA: hypothetical protein VG963_22590 [Polyangiaceae bacterium]|nr:hypothetical protein [Polyangiaceae bacterium]
MSPFSFHIVWEEAPGVRDPVLARTWGRLSISLHGKIITKALDLRANSERDEVYGSMFPIAEWLVENFWFLTSEIPKSKTLSGRFASRALHPWMLRHNFLSAGAGAALPDLTLATDGLHAIAAWFADPAEVSERRTIRFVEEGRARLSNYDVEAGITGFVNSVLARLDKTEYEEVARLQRDWFEVGNSMKSEERLCRRIAQLGLDPYGVDDQLLDTLDAAVDFLPASLENDLLNSEDLSGLTASAAYVKQGAGMLAKYDGVKFQNPSPMALSGTRAHETGYELAHAFRKWAGIPHDRGVSDLNALMHARDVTSATQTLHPSAQTRVKAVIGFSHSHAGLLITPSAPPTASLRFLLGRALGACLLGQCDSGPRLLTDALTWDQAAARAFSAELLAPQAALAQRVRAVMNGDDVQGLARDFNVSELVIAHQIENHQLATIVPD